MTYRVQVYRQDTASWHNVTTMWSGLTKESAEQICKMQMDWHRGLKFRAVGE